MLIERNMFECRKKHIGGLIPGSDSGKAEQPLDLSVIATALTVVLCLPLAQKSPSGIKSFLDTFLRKKSIGKKENLELSR